MKFFFLKQVLVAIALAGAFPITLHAQDSLSVSGRADVVSNYVWRGMDQNAGVSVQPSLGLSYKGFTLSAWGSQSLTHSKENAVQEFDVQLSYSWRGLTLTLADLWWGGLHNPYGYYKEGPAGNPVDGGHHLEATASYKWSDRIPLTLSWSTWVAGADLRRGSGNRCFSTYLSASYDVACPWGVTLTPAVGFTPWKGYYHRRAAFTDISLKASKDFALSQHLQMPLFVQTVVSPLHNHVYLVAGLGIAF